MVVILYIKKNIFQMIIFLYSPYHYMRAWIRVLDAPSCYEHVARVEKKSALYYKAQDWSELWGCVHKEWP